MSSKKEDYSHRLFEQLDRIFIKDSFQNEVKNLRKGLNIPENGFLNWQKWVNWIKNDVKKNGYSNLPKFYSQSAKLNKSLGLTYNYSFWIEAYIVLGGNYMEYNFESPIKNYHPRRTLSIKPDYCNGIELQLNLDCLNIKLYAGASIRETLKYISRNKEFIEICLEVMDKHPVAIRKRSRKSLHNLVYGYYKKGILSRYGITNVEYSNLIPKEIKDIDTDVRRNIIQKEIENRS